MLPIVFVTVSEHIGHQMVINKIVGRNFFENPGLHRSIIGDGVSTMFASIIGGPPSTTYGENIGVLAITKYIVSMSLVAQHDQLSYHL